MFESVLLYRPLSILITHSLPLAFPFSLSGAKISCRYKIYIHVKGTDPPLGGLQSVSSLLIILQRWLHWLPLPPSTPRTPRSGSTSGDLPAIIKGTADSAVTVGCWQQPGLPSHKRGLNRAECRWRRRCEYIEIIGQTLGMQVLTQRHHSPFAAVWTTLIGTPLPRHPPRSSLAKHMVCEHSDASVDEHLTRTFLSWLSSSFPSIFCGPKEPKWRKQVFIWIINGTLLWHVTYLFCFILKCCFQLPGSPLMWKDVAYLDGTPLTFPHLSCISCIFFGGGCFSIAVIANQWTSATFDFHLKSGLITRVTVRYCVWRSAKKKLLWQTAGVWFCRLAKWFYWVPVWSRKMVLSA